MVDPRGDGTAMGPNRRVFPHGFVDPAGMGPDILVSEHEFADRDCLTTTIRDGDRISKRRSWPMSEFRPVVRDAAPSSELVSRVTT